MIWRRSPSKKDDSMSFSESFLSKTKMTATNREQEWLEQHMHVFRTNAFVLIKEIFELAKLPVPPELVDETSVPPESVDEPPVAELKNLVKEALHSIFFLAKIMKFPLDKIFAEKSTLLEKLKKDYEQPFRLCSSHVPQRHPMSCVLDMIVRVSGERNENNIKQRLQQINSRLTRGRNEKYLISTTMCVSQNTETPDSVRYYGVSMSTSGARSRAIMIAASCCVYWDTRVADAVMTYYPDNVRRNDFDRTIRLPEKVRCQAFSITEPLGGKPPCESCKDLFGLHTTKFAYGNCAEVESLSNLFKNEREIKEQSELRSNKYTPEITQQVRTSTLMSLRGLLGFRWNNMFYPNLA